MFSRELLEKASNAGVERKSLWVYTHQGGGSLGDHPRVNMLMRWACCSCLQSYFSSSNRGLFNEIQLRDKGRSRNDRHKSMGAKETE